MVLIVSVSTANIFENIPVYYLCHTQRAEQLAERGTKHRQLGTKKTAVTQTVVHPPQPVQDASEY